LSSPCLDKLRDPTSGLAQGPRFPSATSTFDYVGIEQISKTQVQGRIGHGFFHWHIEQLLNIFSVYLVDLGDTVVVAVKRRMGVTYVLTAGFFPKKAT
jgi:hypothetical protein